MRAEWCGEQLYPAASRVGISGEYDCAMKRWQRYPMKRGVVLSVQMYDRGCDSMMFDHTHTRTPNHVMSHVGSNVAI